MYQTNNMKKTFFQSGVGLLAILSFLLISNAVHVKAADCPGGVCVQTIPGIVQVPPLLAIPGMPSAGTTASSASNLSGYRIVSDPSSCDACRSGATTLNQLSQENGIPITDTGRGSGRIPRIEDSQGRNLGEGVSAIQNKVAELANKIKTAGGGTKANSDVCIIVAPGPSKEYGEFLGTVIPDSATTPAGSDINCVGAPLLVHLTENGDKNWSLRTAGYEPLTDADAASAKNCTLYYEPKQKEKSSVARALESAKGNKIIKTIIPTSAQADEFIASDYMGYTVDGGAKMQPGNNYHPGDMTYKDINGKNVKVSDECKFTSMSDKEIQDLKNQSQGGTNGNTRDPFQGIGGRNGGGSGGGNGGGSGGMSDKLGQLLQGLLGGLGRGGNQNDQASPTPTPFACPTTISYVCGSDNRTYINRCYAEYQGQVSVKNEGACTATDTGSTVCSTTWQPVCGSDAKTYTNTCELQKVSGITITKQGACADNAATGNISTLSALLKQASQSGVPSSVLESAIRAVTNLITSMLSGGTPSSSEVVVP